ncbi:MAG: hypothetical protein R3A48_27050 [Polyangiales bacterium]
MNHTLRLSRRALVALFVLGACSASVGPSATPDNLTLDASVSSVNLAQDCPTQGAGAAQSDARCAANAAGLIGGCGSLCRQSSMQIQLRATGDGVASVRVARVRLLDARTGAFLQDLTARSPQAWRDPGGYVAWDGNITAPQTLRTSFALTAPSWYTITPSQEQYSRSYRVEVTLQVDGVDRVILSSELMREPEVVT